MSALLVIYAFAAAALLLALFVRRIPEGQAYTLRRLDGRMRTLGSGFHLVLPGIERVAHKIPLSGNVVDVDDVSAPGAAQLHGKIYYQVLDAARADSIIDEVGTRLRERLPELVASAPAQDAVTRNLHLKAELNRSLRERGLLVTRVQLA